jgi:hypothetical protein
MFLTNVLSLHFYNVVVDDFIPDLLAGSISCLPVLLAHPEMSLQERLEVQVIERTVDSHQFIAVIACPWAAGQCLVDLFPNARNSLRFDQERRRRSCCFLQGHELHENGGSLLLRVDHLPDTAYLPFDATEPLTQVTLLALVHVRNTPLCLWLHHRPMSASAFQDTPGGIFRCS